MLRLLSLLPLLLAASFAQAGSPSPLQTDNRVAIPLTKTERNQVLYEMREFLHGLHNLQHSLARQDMKSIAVTAHAMGSALDRLPRGMRERLPDEFRQLAIAQTEAFQALAKLADNKAEISAMLDQQAEILTYCSGCHDTYRFEVPLFARYR